MLTNAGARIYRSFNKVSIIPETLPVRVARIIATVDTPFRFSLGKRAMALNAAWSHVSVDKEALRRAAQQQFGQGGRVVVMGRTHEPDEFGEDGNVYFNPGSWIRYADIKSIPNLTLDHLKN